MKIVATLGQGPTLYMLHGWGMHAGIFNVWAHNLAFNFTVNLIDLPGHGDNQNQPLADNADDLADDFNDLPAGIWLGWSLGGLIALNQALHNPTQVKSLIMVCATPCFQARSHWPQGMPEKTVLSFQQSLEDDVKTTINRFLALEVMGVAGQRQQLKILQNLIYDKPLPQKQSLSNGLKLLQEIDLSRALKNLKLPSLWLSGRRDRIVHPEAMKTAAASCQGQFQLLRGGHAPFLQHHPEMTQIIQDYL